MSFGDRIKKARKSKKLTQAELAARLDRDFTSVSKWENDKAEPDRETLLKLSDVLGVSLDWLTGKSEEQIIVDKLKSGVPVVEIEADHDFYYKGKKLNPMEKKMFLDMLENMMKLKEIKE